MNDSLVLTATLHNLCLLRWPCTPATAIDLSTFSVPRIIFLPITLVPKIRFTPGLKKVNHDSLNTDLLLPNPESSSTELPPARMNSAVTQQPQSKARALVTFYRVLSEITVCLLFLGHLIHMPCFYQPTVSRNCYQPLSSSSSGVI